MEHGGRTGTPSSPFREGEINELGVLVGNVDAPGNEGFRFLAKIAVDKTLPSQLSISESVAAP